VIHVIATVELRDGKRDQFLGEFHRLVPLVRSEAGCLEYGPAIDVVTEIPAQVPIRENVVTVVEKWESLEALRAHLVAPHMVEYRGRVKDLVNKVQLQVLAPVSTEAK
jgi:quinol monooxygenase YgiN